MKPLPILKRLHGISTRLRTEFAFRSRLTEYENLLRTALDHGYMVMDNEQWLQIVRGNGESLNRRILVMRHDIDTDPMLAMSWHHIEAALGCRASYFFRLSTTDSRVIGELAFNGAHVSYHFEELADIAKEERIYDAGRLDEIIPLAQARFAHNIRAMRERFNLPMDIVCSHGDWMNRLLRTSNHVLLKDVAFRQEIGIASECYDPEVMTPFSAYLSDGSKAHHWEPSSPIEHIKAGTSPLGILTHPKAWRAHLPSNIRELTRRSREALRYRLDSR